MTKLRYVLPAALLCAVWAMRGAGGAAAAGREGMTLTPGEYQMEWTVPESGEAPDMPMRSNYLSLTPTRPAELKGGPAAGASCRFGAIRIGGDPKTFAVVLEESKGAGKGLDTLTIDTNGNGDLSDEEKLTSRSRPQNSGARWASFPPVTLSVASGESSRKTSVQVSAYSFEPGQWQVQYQVLGYWQGEVATSRGKMKIALLGGSDSGSEKYDRRWSAGPNGQGFQPGTMMMLNRGQGGSGIQYLAEAQLVGGKLYRFTPSATGDHLTIAPYEGPAGTVRATFQLPPKVKLRSTGLSLMGEKGYLNADTGSARVPAGTYPSVGFTAVCDGPGGAWTYSFASPKPVTVSAERTAEVKLGGALKLKAESAASGREALLFRRGKPTAISAQITDAFGGSVRGIYGAKANSPFTAALVNNKGKRMAQASFGFG